MTAEKCVQQMRDAVFQETKLTVSAGIAPNKVSVYCQRSFYIFQLTSLDACKGTFPDVLVLLPKSLICCRYVPIRSVPTNFQFRS